MPYRAPLSDFRFMLDHVVGFSRLRATDRFAEAGEDVTEAVLTEAARLFETVIAPLQRVGDQHPAQVENGLVRMPPGYVEAYRAYAAGGWVGIAAPVEHGGMGLPLTLQTAVNEMLSGACMAFQLCPLLAHGQIEALEAHASDELKALYLPKLVSGQWTATMNLTEPQAGSDVGALTSRAEPQPDGTYAITGQKIYITYGDHDMTENISHLVLARLPDAPAGTKGISLFLVPKFLPDAQGNPGVANAVRVVSLEHKLGLHASPTCVMEFDGAKGWIVGQPGGGLAAMFTMMNSARVATGGQSVGVAEAATQQALAYAMERKQGRAPGLGTIVEHADVRRMLATMRAETFAARALTLDTAMAIDLAAAIPAESAAWQARTALLTPIAKAFCTETAHAVAQIGVQVHGGMGYIEDTGAAQFARDVRVTAIYEGTTGIQAMDLVGRKMMDGGEAALHLIDEVQAGAEAARDAGSPLAEAVWDAAETLREATDWLLTQPVEARFAGAVAYLTAFARVLGGHYHLRAACAEGGQGPRSRLAAFYIRTLLPEHAALLAALRDAADSVAALTPDDLAAA